MLAATPLLPLRGALILALIAVVLFGVWETRRWSAPERRDIISPRSSASCAAGACFFFWRRWACAWAGLICRRPAPVSS